MRLKNVLQFLVLGVAFAGAYVLPSGVCQAQKKVAQKATITAAAQPTKSPAEQSCKAFILMDSNSGEVLSELNSHQPLPPASMVKMMVAYVVFRRIQEGSLKFDDIVTASAHSSKIGGSQVYLKEGEQFTVRELLEALLIQSANDAAMALAEHIAGGSAGFVEMMNAEAQHLGLKDSIYYSPHGLPPGKDQLPDLMSAYDLAILGRALITEFPKAIEYTGKGEGTFRNGTFGLRNHNHLVRTFPGCDGIKTGYYTEAGFGVTATAKKNNMRMIAVVMGCAQSKVRDEEAARLLSSGFARYRSIRVLAKGEAVGEMAPVAAGTKKEISPIATQDLSVLVKVGDEKRIQKKFILCQDLQAPVEKGAPCGEAVISLDGKELGKVNLAVPEDIAKIGLTERFWRLLGR